MHNSFHKYNYDVNRNLTAPVVCINKILFKGEPSLFHF